MGGNNKNIKVLDFAAVILYDVHFDDVPDGVLKIVINASLGEPCVQVLSYI